MTDPLAKEKEYLRSNQGDLAKENPGKYLLIKGETVHGAFETYDEGITGGISLFGSGPFLVRSVLRVEDAEVPSIPALSIGIPFVVNS